MTQHGGPHPGQARRLNVRVGKEPAIMRCRDARMVADHSEHLLKVTRVGSPDAEDSVCIAGDCVRLGNLWDRAHHLPHAVRRDSTLAIDLDKGLDRPAQRCRLDVGGEASNRTTLTEPINASFGGRCGQPDVMPEHGEASRDHGRSAAQGSCDLFRQDAIQYSCFHRSHYLTCARSAPTLQG